jgi:hypothetical protein
MMTLSPIKRSVSKVILSEVLESEHPPIVGPVDL